VRRYIIGHVNSLRIFIGRPEMKAYLGELGIHGRVKLKWDLEIGCGSVELLHLAKEGVQFEFW
jgi:hypothetical protein